MSFKKDRLKHLSKEELIEKYFEMEVRFADSNAHAAVLVADMENMNEHLKSINDIVTSSLNEIYIFSVKSFKFLYCNDSALCNLGYSMEEIHQLNPWDLIKTYSEKSFKKELDHLLKEEEFFHRLETIHTRKDQTNYPVEIRMQKTFYYGEEVIASFCLDITKEKELRSQIQHAAKLASIGELAAGVGHEINNPLAISTGYLSMLKEISFSDEQQKLINRIINAQNRIKKIVDGLRVYSRNDDGAQLTNITIDHCINNTLELIEEMYYHEGISIEYVPDQHIKSNIIGSENWIQQILMNLISNSKDSIVNCKNPKISIFLENKDDEVIIKVSDNGTGIPKHIQNNIFDPFFTTKDVGKGTGLGLGIASELIKKMNGKINFKTIENEGTTFIISFPFNDREMPKIPVNENKLTCKYFFKADIEPVNILFINEESDLLNIYQLFFKEYNCKAFHAIDTKEAIERLKNEQYDIILSDLKMSATNQMEFFKKISTLEFAKSSKFFLISETMNENIINNYNKILELELILLKYRNITKKLQSA